jgi:hypothetical protein
VCEGAKGNWEHERKLGAQKEKTGVQKEKQERKIMSTKKPGAREGKNKVQNLRSKKEHEMFSQGARKCQRKGP